MPLIEWIPAYSVGVSEFDHDHQQIMRMLNELNDAMRERRGKLVVGRILTELLAYTERHFGAEEAAMKRCGYPKYQQHYTEHRSLTQRVKLFSAEFELGDALISIDVLYFLRDWLETHILQSDRAYAECLSTESKQS